MATNVKMQHATQFSAVPTEPSQPSSDDPVLLGQLPGVALTSAASPGDAVTIKTDGSAEFDVEAVDNVPALDPVAVGDILYYDAAATIKINKDSTNGVRFGYALEAIASGNATIEVKLGY